MSKKIKKIYETVPCEKKDCFGNKNHFCQILREIIDKKECPFYKTGKELEDYRKAHPELEGYNG